MASDDIRTKANFTRLSWLLVGKGTEALRKTFDRFHPPATLATVLRVKVTQLQKLKYKVITPKQWDLLSPASGNPDSKNFDITLLTILLRNICGLSPPATGWNTLPPDADRSVEANIARIKNYRNEVYGHVTGTEVDDAEFDYLWKKISQALTDLGIPQREILDLKSCPLNPEEDIYVQQLKEWVLADKKCFDELEKISGKLDKIDRDVNELRKVQESRTEQYSYERCDLRYDHQQRKRKAEDKCTEELEVNRMAHETQRQSQSPKSSVATLAHELYNKPNFSEDILLDLASYNFKGEIKCKSKFFLQGTREWLFKKLDDWFADEESRVMILTAGPGVGKSAFASKVCQVFEKLNKLAACHFCKFNDSNLRNPRRMLESLARHMCDRVEGFKMKLIEQLRQPHEVLCVGDAFRLYLNEPLQNLERSSPMLIVIDALDESSTDGKNDLLDLIAEEFSKLPEWVKILVTSRPEIPVKKKLSHLNPVEILPGDRENDADIQQYLEYSLPGLASELEIIALLVKRCEGSFLFAYYTTTHLSKSHDISTLDLKEIEGLLPQGIGFVYEKYFIRLEEELKAVDKRLDVKRMLEILVAALSPLPLKFISEVFEFLPIDSRSLRKIFGNVNDCLSALFFVYDDCVTVFHKSLVDWLTSDDYDKHRYTVERGRGNEKLWLLCKREFETIKANINRDLKMTAAAEYSVLYGPAQLMNVDREKCCESDYEWLVDMAISFLQLVYTNTMWATMKWDFDFTVVNSCGAKLRMKIIWHLEYCRVDYCHSYGTHYLSSVVNGTDYLQSVVNEFRGIFTGEEKRSARLLLGEHVWCEELRAPGQHDGNLVSAVNIFSHVISCVGVSREKHLFAVGFKDGTVCVLDQELGIVCKFHAKDKRSVSCCVFCPNKPVLLCGDLNSCFNIDTGEKSSFFLNYNEKYTTCSFSPSGNSLLTADQSVEIKVWDVEKQILLRKIWSDHNVDSCQYSESGRFIIACSLNVNVVDDHQHCFPDHQHLDIPHTQSTIWNASTFEGVAQRDVTILAFDDIKLSHSLRNSVEEGDLHTEEGVEKNRKGFHINKCFDVQGTEFFLCAKGQELHVYLLPMPFPVTRLVDRDYSLSRYLQSTRSWSVLHCSPHSWNKLAYLPTSDPADDLLSLYFGLKAIPQQGLCEQLSLISESEGLYARYKELFLVKLPRPAASLSSHFRIVWCSFSADGLRLASCCDNGIVQIWDVNNCQVVQSFSWPVCLGCYWSERYFWTIQSEGCRLVISRLPVDECLSIKYDAEDKIFQETEFEELLTLSEGVFVFKRKDGFASFISVTEDGRCSPAKTLPGIHPVLCAAVSPGGCSILTCSTKQYEIWAGDGNSQCHSWELPERHHLFHDTEYMIQCSITSNGEKGVMLVTGSYGDPSMFVVDMRSDVETTVRETTVTSISRTISACCVGTQSHIAILGDSGEISIWNLTTIDEVGHWNRKCRKKETCVSAYSRKQSIFAVADFPGKIVFFRIHFPE